MVLSCYQELRPECQLRVFTLPESRRKLAVSMLMATAITVNQYLKLWVDIYTSAHAKKPFHLCQNKTLKGGNTKREMDKLRGEHIRERCYNIQELRARV